MSTIKNWFVRSQRVKEKHMGLIKYTKYLIDLEHSNHKGKTDRIIPLYGSIDTFIKNAAAGAISVDLGNGQKKGGRPIESYAQSFVLGLPPSVQKPTDQQWKAIFGDVLKAMAKKMELPLDSLKGHVFANIHDQNNPHMNLVISRVIEGKAVKALDQRAVIITAKRAFTASTLSRCGLDIRSYTPLQTNVGHRQERWQIIQKEAEIRAKKADDAVDRLDMAIGNAKRLGTLTAMLNSQLIKWMDAILTGDEKQELRQENRINSATIEINELSIDPETAMTIENLIKTAETKAGKNIKFRKSKLNN